MENYPREQVAAVYQWSALVIAILTAIYIEAQRYERKAKIRNYAPTETHQRQLFGAEVLRTILIGGTMATFAIYWLSYFGIPTSWDYSTYIGNAYSPVCGSRDAEGTDAVACSVKRLLQWSAKVRSGDARWGDIEDGWRNVVSGCIFWLVYGGIAAGVVVLTFREDRRLQCEVREKAPALAAEDEQEPAQDRAKQKDTHEATQPSDLPREWTAQSSHHWPMQSHGSALETDQDWCYVVSSASVFSSRSLWWSSGARNPDEQIQITAGH